jgi:GNAT superfamily N-acetyltransferase
MSQITAPRKLERADVREGFDSGAPDLDQWLVKYAWQNQQANNAVTYVITDGGRVVGYYAIAMAAVAKQAAPPRLEPKTRPGQIPCILLARLAVDRDHQGQGLGFELLRDALLRAVGLSASIGAVAVIVHCRDDAAKAFYLHMGDFLQSPEDDLHLIAPIKDLRRYVDGPA